MNISSTYEKRRKRVCGELHPRRCLYWIFGYIYYRHKCLLFTSNNIFMTRIHTQPYRLISSFWPHFEFSGFVAILVLDNMNYYLWIASVVISPIVSINVGGVGCLITRQNFHITHYFKLVKLPIQSTAWTVLNPVRISLPQAISIIKPIRALKHKRSNKILNRRAWERVSSKGQPSNWQLCRRRSAISCLNWAAEKNIVQITIIWILLMFTLFEGE